MMGVSRPPRKPSMDEYSQPLLLTCKCPRPRRAKSLPGMQRNVGVLDVECFHKRIAPQQFVQTTFEALKGLG